MSLINDFLFEQFHPMPGWDFQLKGTANPSGGWLEKTKYSALRFSLSSTSLENPYTSFASSFSFGLSSG